MDCRPFNFGTKVPTHQELLGVDSDAFAHGCTTSQSEDFCSKSVFDSLYPTEGVGSDEPESLGRFFLAESESEKITLLNPSKSYKEQLILLSRSERLDVMRQSHSLPLSTNITYPAHEEPSISTLDQSSRLLTPENEDPPELANILDSSILNYESDIHDERDQKKFRVDFVTDCPASEIRADKNTDDALPLTVDPKDLYLTNLIQFSVISQPITDQNEHPTIANEEWEPMSFTPDVSETAGPRVNEEPFINKEHHLKPSNAVTKAIYEDKPSMQSSFYPRSSKPEATFERLDKLPPRDNLLLCERRSLNAFLGLRGRKAPVDSESVLNEVQESPKAPSDSTHSNEQAPVTFSDEDRIDLLRDTRAFTVPEPRTLPSSEHAYLCSIDFIQQRLLTRALESDDCQVRLIGRESLASSSTTRDMQNENIPHSQHSADISIIVAPDAAVVFFPLAALPSEKPRLALFEALARHSWRYARILLVLTAFPRSHFFRLDKTTRTTRKGGKGKEKEDGEGRTSFQMPSGPCAYSPPALRACRRLRREIALRVGVGEQREECTVELAFADTVQHAARLIRAFGDAALCKSIVDMAPYLGEEEQDVRIPPS